MCPTAHVFILHNLFDPRFAEKYIKGSQLRNENLIKRLKSKERVCSSE